MQRVFESFDYLFAVFGALSVVVDVCFYRDLKKAISVAKSRFSAVDSDKERGRNIAAHANQKVKGSVMVMYKVFIFGLSIFGVSFLHDEIYIKIPIIAVSGLVCFYGYSIHYDID